MNEKDFKNLLADTNRALLDGQICSILGLTEVTIRLLNSLDPSCLIQSFDGIYINDVSKKNLPKLSLPIKNIQDLAKSECQALVVAEDDGKEDLIEMALPYLAESAKIIIAGYGHLAFRDKLFNEEYAQLLVPSLANGYPNTLIHIYQCLRSAARLDLDGIVVEFGMFKGGTTMFISRIIERLGMNWSVYGFDTFAGFPPQRSPLDMYAHPDCVFTDLDSVKRYLDGRNVEIVIGDIYETYMQLENKNIILSFFDTDNYSSSAKVLELIKEQIVVGGAIVFDHFTGVDRFRYTLGERFAGKILLADPRYFHLHDTGVFLRQK